MTDQEEYEWFLKNWEKLPENVKGKTWKRTLQNIQFELLCKKGIKEGIWSKKTIYGKVDSEKCVDGSDFIIVRKDKKGKIIHIGGCKFQDLELEELNKENKIQEMAKEIKKYLSYSSNSLIIYWITTIPSPQKPILYNINKLKELEKYCTEEELNRTYLYVIPNSSKEIGMLSLWDFIIYEDE